MSDETALDEGQEGIGTPLVDSDDIQDEYELNDVEEGDYYGTDDDEGEGAYTGGGQYGEYAQGDQYEAGQYGEYAQGESVEGGYGESGYGEQQRYGEDGTGQVTQ